MESKGPLFFRGSIWLSVLQWGLISHFHLPGCKQFLQTNPQINGYTGTPPKINIEPENDGFEDDVPFQLGKFRVHVDLPGCNLIIKSASQDYKKSNLDSFLKPEWRLIIFHHFHPSFSSTRVLLQNFPITLKCLPLPFHDFSPAHDPTIHLPKREMLKIWMFPKIVVPPKSSILIGFSWVFHYKPSILGYPYLWKHPYGKWNPHFFHPASCICWLFDATFLED